MTMKIVVNVLVMATLLLPAQASTLDQGNLMPFLDSCIFLLFTGVVRNFGRNLKATSLKIRGRCGSAVALHLFLAEGTKMWHVFEDAGPTTVHHNPSALFQTPNVKESSDPIIRVDDGHVDLPLDDAAEPVHHEACVKTYQEREVNYEYRPRLCIGLLELLQRS